MAKAAIAATGQLLWFIEAFLDSSG